MPIKYHFCNSLSWESGQDVSSRFGPQQTGGTIIQHVRPVDLQASMAQGAAILARWAEVLAPSHSDETQENPYPAEIAFWDKSATEFIVKTRLMWRDGWFCDYDSVAGVWSSERDAMHLAPIVCGAAGREQIEQLRPLLAEPPRHSSQWAPLSWPPVVMTLIGATSAAQMPQEAAELAYRFIDASYRSTDSRELDEHGGLPGITREYRSTIVRGKWDETDYINAGIEGYGWGALSVHLLMRHLLGLQEEKADLLNISPTLPQVLRRKDASYRIDTLPWGNYLLRIECLVKDTNRYRLRLRCRVCMAIGNSLADAEGGSGPEKREEYQCEWEDAWGAGRSVQLPQLVLSPIEHGE